MCKLGDFGESKDLREQTMTMVLHPTVTHLLTFTSTPCPILSILTRSKTRAGWDAHVLVCVASARTRCALLIIHGKLQALSHCCSAPEVLRSEQYDESADVFSFAVTLVACFKRGRGYDKTEPFSMSGVKHSGLRPSIPAWDPATEAGCPERVAALVRECWSEDAMNTVCCEISTLC